MPVAELDHKAKLPEVKGQTDNACWAACGVALSTYYKSTANKGQVWTQDLLAKFVGTPLTDLASIEDVLALLKCVKSATDLEVDDHNLPTTAEIVAELSAGRPMIVGIGTKPLANPKTQKLTGGHYMVIVGADDPDLKSTKPPQKIEVMDPHTGKFTWTPSSAYNENGYKNYAFCKTFYTNTPT